MLFVVNYSLNLNVTVLLFLLYYDHKFTKYNNCDTPLPHFLSPAPHSNAVTASHPFDSCQTVAGFTPVYSF